MANPKSILKSIVVEGLRKSRREFESPSEKTNIFSLDQNMLLLLDMKLNQELLRV